ncbi:hypothetical protein HMPREF0281_02139 [Corynebacterium ammoniagenes DSM 20306]|uniref:Uncharacterized protein n=1 Tax=Corynebacterium ammoniagenes DSM 20306 TaxID=649754 RepID=A0ABP2IHI7_CORAM|nr:hypothetical protein HMPREF0281_02139 [Corynebacterium ammoniagenes DSM 20306]
MIFIGWLFLFFASLQAQYQLSPARTANRYLRFGLIKVICELS